jgi:hypothetical protein
MALETVTDIDDLVITNPTSTDPKSAGDDHLRNIKIALKNGFPGFTGSVIVTGTDGGSANTYTLTPSTALPAYVAGTLVCMKVTNANTGASTLNISGLGAGAIQSVSGAALTSGDLPASRYAWMVVTAATPVFQLLGVTKNYVDQLAFGTEFPNQSGNADKVPTTDGTNVSWTDSLKATILRWVDGSDITKKLAFNLAGITTATTRTLTVPDHNGTILTTGATVTVPQGGTGVATFTDGGVLVGNGAGAVQVTTAGTTGQVLTSNGAGVDPTFQASTASLILLSTVAASSSATVDIETTFDDTYDAYMLVISGLTVSDDAANVLARLKIGGSYIGTATYDGHLIQVSGAASTYAGASLAGGQSVRLVTAVGSAASACANIIVYIHNPESTAFAKGIHWQGNYVSSVPNYAHCAGAGYNTGTAAMTGIRFLPDAGTFLAGTFRLYGIKK